MSGFSTTGSISLGCALVAGRNLVPSPAAGRTALRTRFGISDIPFLVCCHLTWRLHPVSIHRLADRFLKIEYFQAWSASFQPEYRREAPRIGGTVRIRLPHRAGITMCRRLDQKISGNSTLSVANRAYGRGVRRLLTHSTEPVAKSFFHDFANGLRVFTNHFEPGERPHLREIYTAET